MTAQRQAKRAKRFSRKPFKELYQERNSVENYLKKLDKIIILKIINTKVSEEC